jgi:tRNA A-37 threonylcarbamoyl transferase component Bud32
VSDPFIPPALQTPAAGKERGDADPVRINGLTFERVVVHANGGGTYRARTGDGTAVFVKEARGHNGYQWDRSAAVERLRREHRTLVDIHTGAPGLCPRPVDYFAHWEHEFLVTEWVDGDSLWTWMARNNPTVRAAPTRGDFDAYHDRSRRLLADLQRQVDRLHELGYVFIDLNPRNVLVDDDDRPRLIDFESASRIDGPLHAMGAEGYYPPEANDPATAAALDPRYYDEYGMSALTLALLGPIHSVVERSPVAFDHLRAVLGRFGGEPSDLWTRAGLVRRSTHVTDLPTPAEVDREPARWLDWLRERTLAGLLAMAEFEADPVFPTCPAGWAANRLCVAFGTAGVLHALWIAGHRPDRRLVASLVDAARRNRHDLPPGLLVGRAGIAWVLAELGELEAARDLLAGTDRDPLAIEEATLGYGSAGVALAHLALHEIDPDPALRDRAVALLQDVPTGPALAGLLGPDEASGWRRGRAGIALAHYYAARLAGADVLLERGRELLSEELVFAVDDGTGLGFRGHRTDQRSLPYLGAGSAGFAAVAGRYLDLDARPDDRLDTAYRAALRSTAAGMTLLAGLFDGVAGLGLVLSERAALSGDPQLGEFARRSARTLFAHAVGHPSGVRFLGGLGTRFSADLATGSAGVLLFLTHLHTGCRDPLFTLDQATANRPEQHTVPARSEVNT